MDGQTSKVTWERLWTERRRIFHYRNIVEIVDRTPVAVKGSKVLEVGCGRGATLLEFARRGAIVTGVDYAESALAFCKELQAEAMEEGNVRLAEFVQADARELPFESGTFDVVYSVGLLEHFDDPAAILSEQCRVLKDAGYLILQVPQKYSAYTVLKKVLIALKRWPYGAWETQYSEHELRGMVAERGLAPEYAYGYGSFALAVLRHFFFPTLDHGMGGWHRDDGGMLKKLKANSSLDVGVVARKIGVPSEVGCAS